MSGYIGTQPVPQATQTRDSFTATSGQTSFATGGYTPQFLDVYLNGVKLAAADYTASNGSDVVLASGAATGDILEVVAYTTFTVGSSFTPSIDDNGNATAITIDSSENVNIGTSPASDKLSVNGTVSVNDSTYSVYASGISSNIGSVGNTANDLNIFSTATGHNGLRFHSVGILPTDNTGTIIDNDCDLGVNTHRFKDLYLSGGVYLGGTGSANKLDDYESGDIDIANLTFTGSGSATTNTNYQTLRYTKVGQVVSITGNIYLASVTSQNGALKIPLPFTSGTGEKHRTASGTANASSNTPTFIKVDAGSSFGTLITSSGFATVTVSAGQTYLVHLTYTTS